MIREADILSQLSERPFDRELRLVYADWLQEQGDPRGEVIALSERGNLSLTERRRVARITSQHARAWLGPLGALADPHRTRFVGGFLHELACVATAPAEQWAALTGEPRLATVKILSLPPRLTPTPLTGFLSAPVLRGLARLELGTADWKALARLQPLGLQRAVVSSWGVFTRELAGLELIDAFTAAPTLGLASTEFANALVVTEIIRQVHAQLEAVRRFEEVRLFCRYGVMEGAARWLLEADRATDGLLPEVRRWSVEASEVAFTRVRGDTFSELRIDLSLPEARSGEKELSDSSNAFERRLAAAAGVLVQLAPAQLRSVKVLLAPGARLRPAESDTLRRAARRSGVLESFVIEENAAPNEP